MKFPSSTFNQITPTSQTSVACTSITSVWSPRKASAHQSILSFLHSTDCLLSSTLQHRQQLFNVGNGGHDAAAVISLQSRSSVCLDIKPITIKLQSSPACPIAQQSPIFITSSPSKPLHHLLNVSEWLAAASNFYLWYSRRGCSTPTIKFLFESKQCGVWLGSDQLPNKVEVNINNSCDWTGSGIDTIIKQDQESVVDFWLSKC